MKVETDSPPPFFSPGAASDDEYTFIRESEHWGEHREHIEKQWQRFAPLCGDGCTAFLSDARTHGKERVWEMQLACILLDRGHQLRRPPSDAPDILCNVASTTVWIEATVAGRGSGADAVDPPQVGFSYPDHDKMILRYTNSLASKVTQGREFRSRRVISGADAYVAAINASDIPNSDIEIGIPDIVRGVLGLGRHQYVAPVMGATGPVTTRWPIRREVTKKSGATVSTASFLDDAASDVSAVMFTARSPWTMRAEHDALVTVIHNPYARTPLPRGAFSFGSEWWLDLEAGQLRCKRWHMLESKDDPTNDEAHA